MRGVTESSAEEFYEWCLGNAQTLERAARRYAAAGEVVPAVAAAWGADVSTVQAVTWERILVAARAPQRQFFRVAEALTSVLRAQPEWPFSPSAARDVLESARAGMAQAFDRGLAEEMESRWPEIAYLDALAAPTAQDVEDAVDARLQGHTIEEFVAERRRAAAEAMAEAQGARIRGDVSGAIQSAYESDFLGLEAYLVESAMAAADTSLFTVIVRWTLASDAISELTGLPDDFSTAVALIRRTLATSLGEADGGRLLATLVAT